MYVLDGVGGWAGKVDSIAGLWVRGDISEWGTNAIYIHVYIVRDMHAKYHFIFGSE
jgi:hypothetical protein